MPRYVDADCIVKLMREVMNENKDDSAGSKFACFLFNSFIHMLNRAPAEDVAPVRKSHWIYHSKLEDGNYEFKCSGCLRYAYVKGWVDEDGECYADIPDYCPHCGAKTLRILDQGGNKDGEIH